MTPGPTYVYECSQCHGLFNRRSIASGNTLRARYRSDGRMDAPMLPSTPLLSACPHCNSPVFWPDAVEVTSYETYLPRFFSKSELSTESQAYEEQQFALEQKYKTVSEYSGATTSQVLEFLSTNKLSEEHEFALRIQYWWLFNDDRLAGNRAKLTSEERENLKKIQLQIGQDGDSLLLQQAEIFRELGSFEDAKKMLDCDFQDRQAAIAEQLMRAVEEENSLPFIFVSSDNQYDYECAWTKRRYVPESPSKYNSKDLNPPVFKISNRDWWVKVLGMLSHNWALIERNPEGSATVYFFQDHPFGDRPAVVDSLEFQKVMKARQGLTQNGFKRLKDYPGPWMGCEPKGFIYDKRSEANKLYSNGKYWRNKNE